LQFVFILIYVFTIFFMLFLRLNLKLEQIKMVLYKKNKNILKVTLSLSPSLARSVS
jgi:hypothetical protein